MNIVTIRRFCSILLCILGFLPSSLQAATYYISAKGSDSNDGLSVETPWQSLAKINSLDSSVTQGSSFLFRRGDLFRGEIRLPGYTDHVHFGAYGVGENPIISGSVAISGWSPYAGSIYVADVSSQVAAGESIDQLFVDNRRMLTARYPNVASALPDPDQGWLEVESSIDKKTVTDSSLQILNRDPDYWAGGRIRIRSFSWLFETRTIVSSTTAGQIVMDEPLTETLAAFIQPGWGFYLENVLGELDHENEYFFDPVERKIYLYAPGGVNPETVLVEGTVYNRGCFLDWHYHDMSVEHITFRHQREDGVQILNCNNVRVAYCRFENIGGTGVNMAWNSRDVVIENNQFSDILTFGIKFIATTAEGGFQPGSSAITDNVIHNTAMIAGYGGSGVAVACGIRTYGVRGLHITGNIIENTGYAGMHLEGGGHLVENNVVSHSLLTLDDGGGIFINSPDNIVRNNIVTDTWGNRGPSSGTHGGRSFDNNQMGMGIFFQPNLSGNIIEGNTFAHNRSHGIYPDRATNTTISGNVSYDNGSGAYHGAQLYLTGTPELQNNIFTDNILIAGDYDQYSMRTDSSLTIGAYDNEMLCNVQTAMHIRDENSGSGEITLPQWKASAINPDQRSVGCPAGTALVSRILINSSGSERPFYLGPGSFLNHLGTPVDSTVRLPPFSSLVIFQESSAFYSLIKLISILEILAGSTGPDLSILEIYPDGLVTIADAIALLGILAD